MKSIIFNDDGTVDFTRDPALLNLFSGERKEIVRMTDILHDPESDKFYFRFLTGPFKGRDFTSSVFADVVDAKYVGEGPCPPVAVSIVYARGGIWFADTYEDCAKLEVWFVEFMRQLGMKLDA